MERAERGDVAAQNDLAYRYYEGNGVEKSFTKAVMWYKKAADQGHQEAAARLKGASYPGAAGRK